jgi:hypothetical protein
VKSEETISDLVKLPDRDGTLRRSKNRHRLPTTFTYGESTLRGQCLDGIDGRALKESCRL